MVPRQYRIHALLIVVAAVIIIYPLLNQRPSKEQAAAATQAALAFLQQVDAGQFAQSWQMTAAATRETIGEQEWVAHLAKVHAITGPVVTRTEASMALSDPVDKGQEGVYIVITYATAYQHKADAGEIVTVMLAPDGVWRVAGYYIK